MKLQVKARVLDKEITGYYEPLELLKIIDDMIVRKKQEKEGV